MSDAARAAAESAARASYGRLLAFVASRTRDVAAAEDALAEAFAAALDRWPVTGVPELVYAPTGDEFKADDFSLSGPYEPLLTDRAAMVV